MQILWALPIEQHKVRILYCFWLLEAKNLWPVIMLRRYRSMIGIGCHPKGGGGRFHDMTVMYACSHVFSPQL